ncbi:lysylphosphatidylglycerol synthase transmembrane domain-containing protein [Bacteroides sp.]|uniref:lysylphosphatidylglycerol synthase transmembrane domain-containing protein n=1 Tax=Bacteroides sp. TaxID=29523 RepID=UPI003AB5529E
MNKKHIILAVLLGLSVIAYLFYKDFDLHTFSDLRFSKQMICGILLALLCFVCQNAGMMWRYRLLTERLLSWQQVFRVNVLCEFTSAITPSSVGGSSLIFLYLYKEGINAGKSTAIMIASLFLDELFLCLSCITVVCLLPLDVLFGEAAVLTSGIKWLFLLIVAAVSLWTAVLYVALFHRPQWVKAVLLTFFSMPLLRRWKEKIRLVTDELVIGSQEISHHKFRFWIKPFLATAAAWCFRYAIVNALLFAFTSGGNQLLAFARQWVLWMISIASPTPGGSGLSEYMFKVYYTDFLPNVGTTLLVALVWRIITYYSYLIAGVCIVPRWIKEKTIA